jgi:hypothetical protein
MRSWKMCPSSDNTKPAQGFFFQFCDVAKVAIISKAI